TGTYSDGSTRDVTTTATWTSLTPAIATVSTTGLVTSVAAQSGVAITATIGALNARCVVSVTNPGFALVGISLTPQTLWVGQRMPYPFVSADFGGVGSNYTFVTWTQSNPAVARLDPVGYIYALAAGTTTLTATTATATSTLTASNTLTVTEPPLSSIAVLPILPRIAQGAVLQMAATGVYPDANLNKDLTATVTWASSNPAAVTVDAAGLARGVGAGTAVLSAKSGTVTGSTTATVPTITPPQTTVMLSPVNDNTVMYSSLVPARQTTVYPTVAMFSNPAVAVGCSWFYSPAIGFAPEHIDAACSRALIKFDLSSLAGKTIVSAKLRLQTSIYGVGYVPRRWTIFALATAWNGASVTWNNSTNFLHYVYSQSIHDPPTFGGQLFELEQTTTVQNWVGGSYVNQGYELGLTSMLLPNVNTVSLDQFEFHSAEDPGGRGPKLVVTYQ
ncbi:MAG: Ig protein, partial [Myxococcaceae bacterium]|nr:Ig protein [Myxococcaceae bacterium]